MPVIAVGAAMMAAAEIATVGIAAMSTFSIVASVGAIAAGIGVVTGNETLTKIGGIMSVVGGVGSLATAAGGTGSAMADDFANEAMGSSQAASAPGNAAEAAVSSALPDAPTVTPLPPSEAITSTPLDSTAVQAGESVTGTATPTALASDQAATSSAGMINSGQAASSAPGPTGSFSDLVNPPKAYSQVVNAAGDASTGSTILDKILGFAKGNDKLSAAMLNVGGNLVGGLFDPTKPAEVAALQARAAADNAATALAEQRTKNMGAPAPTASGSGQRQNVFGTNNPNVYAPPKVAPGLISTPAVTGRV